jgi:hypothetical protein
MQHARITEEYRTLTRNFHSWWWNYLDPRYSKIQTRYWTYVAKMRLSYQMGKYPYAVLLDEDELFMMKPHERESMKVY